MNLADALVVHAESDDPVVAHDAFPVILAAARRLAEGERLWWCDVERDLFRFFEPPSCDPSEPDHEGCGWKLIVDDSEGQE